MRVHDDDRVQMVQAFLRKKGENVYGFYSMTEVGPGRYRTEIPAHHTDGEGVEYHILAADPAGNATMKGNGAFPLFLDVEPGPAARPWYQKWWVWAILAAAAGAGAALGVTLSGSGSGSNAGNATLSIHLQEGRAETAGPGQAAGKPPETGPHERENPCLPARQREAPGPVRHGAAPAAGTANGL